MAASSSPLSFGPPSPSSTPADVGPQQPLVLNFPKGLFDKKYITYRSCQASWVNYNAAQLATCAQLQFRRKKLVDTAFVRFRILIFSLYVMFSQSVTIALDLHIWKDETSA